MPNSGQFKNFLLTLITVASLLASPQAWAGLKIYRTGNAIDVKTPSSQSICLAGGGLDDEWADGWRFLIRQSGGGDVVVIRADGSRGGYEDWIYNDPDRHQFPKVNSVTTISIADAKDANRTDVEQLILNAELVFFAGGDQSLYIDYFRGSKLLSAVEYVMNVKKVPVAGSSAGMALLADIDYASHYGSPLKKNSIVTALDVINEPTGTFVDLDRTVLKAPYMNQVITDTHFAQRAREGRLTGFMARAVYNNYSDVSWSNIKGIGADEGTAVCYDSTGIAKVFGAGNAHFLKGNAPIERITAGHTLSWLAGGKAVQAYVIHGTIGTEPTASFDLKSWTGSGGRSEFWFIDGANEANTFFGRK